MKFRYSQSTVWWKWIKSWQKLNLVTHCHVQLTLMWIKGLNFWRKKFWTVLENVCN